MTKAKRALSLALCVFAVSCSTHHPNAVRVYEYGLAEGSGSTGAHAVRQGDTVESIAAQYNLPIGDIINLNNLEPPYFLQKGRRIFLPAPQTYNVQEGDTLYTISRTFKTDTTSLARLNDLRHPYTLTKGQIIKLPSTANKQVLAQAQVSPIDISPPPVELPLLEPVNSVSASASEGQSASANIETILNIPYDPSKATVTSVPVPKAAPQKSVVPEKTVLPKVSPRAGSKFLRPVQGRILSSYGPKADTLHNDGINIAAPEGASVFAAENGVVIYAGDEIESFGNLILLRHADNFVTAYGHLSNISVQKGSSVFRGETIGSVGSSGNVQTPQLHFEIRKGSSTLNPELYID